MRRKLLFSVPAVAVLAVLAAAITHRPEIPGGRIVVHFTAGLSGVLDPCGCDPSERGGLARRLSVISDARAADASHVFVDAGDFIGIPTIEGFDRKDNPGFLSPNKRRFCEIKMDALMKGFGFLGIDAICPGEADFMLGQSFLREWGRSLPFVSSNVVYANSGNPVFRPYRVKVIGRGRFLGIPYGGVRVGIFALTFESAKLKHVKEDINDILSLPVITAAVGTIRELTGPEGCTVIICLFHGTRGQAEMLLSQVKDIDLLIVGHEWQPEDQKPQMGRTLIAGVPARGMAVGEASLKLSPSKTTAGGTVRLIPLDPSQKEHEAGLAILREFREKVRSASLEPDEQADAGGRFAGSGKCARCHEEESAQWSGTSHSRAYSALAARGQDADPECLQCHTTGYGLVGGFAKPSDSPLLAGVGCEVCHGPSAKHVEEKEKIEAEGRIKPPVRDAHRKRPLFKICTSCHTPQRDRFFERNSELRFKRIKHR